ncbi:SDR family NAD(P)-dependent oxidoreductase [Marinobacterium aestuariivivens]|uniref:SDR family NAD(P)-dependent oxidoreductase n=1 Tax=Marinobacterium aestuariivivens TaxID=1698799 RepID=A0ABW2A3S2_9GAMM
MTEFEGKVAVVTGAASGIGEALALRAADEGMAVVLADVDRQRLDALRRQLKTRGTRALAVPTDVSDAAQVDRLARETLAAFGRVDLLFNNAGVLLTGRCWERSLQDWQWVLGVNLWGVINGIRSFVPLMLERGEPAHIVNMASMAGLLAAPMNGPYTVSKQGVVALSETLHFELQAEQSPVKVSVVCPGPVATAIVDSEQHRPSELANPAAPGPAEEQPFAQMLRQGIAAGIDPQALAGQVFDAVCQNRFWVMSHAGFEEPLKRRVDGLVSGSNPVYQMAAF